MYILNLNQKQVKHVTATAVFENGIEIYMYLYIELQLQPIPNPCPIIESNTR